MIAFVLTGFICLLFVMAGFPLVLNAFKGWLPLVVLDTVASLSFLSHYTAVSKGVLSLHHAPSALRTLQRRLTQ